MLTAITHGKAGRVRLPGSEADVSWRDVFRQREDLLTAVFFSRLPYLSDPALVRVMGLLVGDTAAAALGAWNGIEFWPRLEQLDGRSWVEPDVLLQFEHATVMIEVKPPFGGEQSAAQWQMELEALVAEFMEAGTAAASVVHFVALGHSARVPATALAGFDTKGLFELSVHRVEWEELAARLSDLTVEASRTDAAVFGDWSDAFELFGLRSRIVPDWNSLADWSARHPVSADVIRCWTRRAARSTAMTPAPATTPSVHWASLLEFCQRHPLELLA